MDIIIKGNTKVGKKVGVFNLPPKLTCTPTEWCEENCYGCKNKHCLPNVKKANAWRHKESLKDDFVDRVAKRIGKRKYFRIHANGDFYSDEYVKKWAAIADRCPGTKFLAFTKRVDLTGPIVELAKRPNVIIRESLDKSKTKPTMGLKFAAIDHFKYPKRKNPILCAGTCEECGYRCWNEPEKDVILHEH